MEKTWFIQNQRAQREQYMRENKISEKISDQNQKRIKKIKKKMRGLKRK
jgi:hypothetical protein